MSLFIQLVMAYCRFNSHLSFYFFTVQWRKMIRNPLHMLNHWERLDRESGPMQSEKHMGNVGHTNRLNFYFGFMRGDVLYCGQRTLTKGEGINVYVEQNWVSNLWSMWIVMSLWRIFFSFFCIIHKPTDACLPTGKCIPSLLRGPGIHIGFLI